MIEKHEDSHLDHNLTVEQISYILSLLAPDDSVMVQTVELPAELGLVPCGLYGPAMGDAPMGDADGVTFVTRGDRKGPSRVMPYGTPSRYSRLVTFVTGPHDGRPCVLFTAYGGPSAPREPFDDDSADSAQFWSQHALAHSLDSAIEDAKP